MTVWFSKIKRGSYDNIYRFAENGKDVSETTLSAKAEICYVDMNDEQYINLITLHASQLKGFKTSNDNKDSVPSAWAGKPVIIAIQKVEEVTREYKGNVTKTQQTLLHKYLSTVLATSCKHGDFIKLANFNATHSEEVLSSLTDSGDGQYDESEAQVYSKLLFNFSNVDKADIKEEVLKQYDDLLTQLSSAKTSSSGYGNKNYAPKETTAERLKAKTDWFINHLDFPEGTKLLASLTNEYLGLSVQEALAVIVELAKD